MIQEDNYSVFPENTFEILIMRVSGNNFFQYKMFANFMLKWILSAMILFSLNFFYFVPNFQCTDEQMIGFDTCEDFVCSVDSQEFWLAHMPKPLPRSISLDYGIIMVCSKEWISSTLQSVSYCGSLIGYIVMPLIADNKGRKIAEFISWIITVLGCGVLLISMNLPLVGIGSFMMGFGANSAITLHYSFIKQLVTVNIGQRMIIILQISFSFGVFLIALCSWFIFDWKLTLGLIILAPSCILLLLKNWIQDTPQFNLEKGIQYFVSFLNRIARQNKVQLLTIQQIKEKQLQCQRNKQKFGLSFIDLFRYKSLIKLTIVCALIDFVIEFTYDGTILSLDKLGINVYLDQMLVGLVEIFAAIFASYIVAKVYRKLYCQISFVLVSVFTAILGILSLVEDHKDDTFDTVSIFQMLVLACLRITLSAVWGIFFVFIAELFPSQITSVSFGWVSIVGTVGATISPFIRLATAQFTLFLMAILNICSFFLIKLLHQTKGRQIRFRIKQRQINYVHQTSVLSQDS